MSVPGGGTPPVVLATSASGAIPSRDDLLVFLLWVTLCVMAIFWGHLLELHFKP